MSCGRNRRRPKLSSTLNSRLYNHPESSSPKIHSLSHGRKSNHSEPSSKQISRENTDDFDRFRVNIFFKTRYVCILRFSKILDDKGNDVTPRLITDYVRINLKNRREDEKSLTEPSVSERNLSTSTSQMIHTGTLFSAG
jgi:uncharacterized protein YnzC (UPF0291/DUF896 family)